LIVRRPSTGSVRNPEAVGWLEGGVHFPDLLGCTSAGASMEEAVENADKALRLWAEDETELPKASTLDSLRKRPDVCEDLAAGGMVLCVPLGD
jgi:hypothetical protein